MDGTAEPEIETIEEPIPTLGELHKMSIEERCNWLLDWAGPEFEKAVEAVREDFFAYKLKIEFPSDLVRRVSWAVAYNIDSFLLTEEDLNKQKKPDYRWSSDYSWGKIWRKIQLEELTISILCEKQSKWREPDIPSLDDKITKIAFDFIWKKYYGKVLRYVKVVHGSHELPPEDITQIAWKKIIRTRWSSKSSKRFHGFCNIFRALRVIIDDGVVKDIYRKQGKEALERPEGDFSKDEGSFGHLEGLNPLHVFENDHGNADQDQSDLSPSSQKSFRKWKPPEELEDHGIFKSPIENVQGNQVFQFVGEAIEELSKKKRERYKLYLFQGKTIKELADLDGVNSAGVSTDITEAKEHIWKYLQKRGIPVPRTINSNL